MKNIFLILASLLLFTACGDEKYNEPPKTNAKGYLGTLKTEKLDDSSKTYNDGDVNFEIDFNTNGTATLTMRNTHFVERMPRLTMVVPGISASAEVLGSRTLSCGAEGIVPMCEGIAYDQYKITNLTGKVQSGNLILEFNCIGYKVNYNGSAIAK